MSIPLFVPSGGGEFVNIRDAKKTYLKLTSQDSDGQFGFFEHHIAPRTSGSGPHVHPGSTAMFYVVDGEISFTIGDQKEVGMPGAFAYVPKGVPHGFTNVGSEDAILLIMFYPAHDLEDYVDGLRTLTGDGPNPSSDDQPEHLSR